MKQTKLVLSGKTLNLADNMEIKSNNFNVDSKGNMICNNATIKGGKINLPIDNNYPGITIGNAHQQDDGENLWIRQNYIYITNNNNNCQIALDTSNEVLYISKQNQAGHTTFLYPGEINVYTDSSTIYTKIKGEGISTPTLTQTSLAESKKNFEKLQDNALETIKGIDIYKYNLKNEKDTDKKHIGFVIGDNYNYSKEVTSIDNQGVDNYSFTSLCCKAIQEQQEQIEELKKEINKLKGEKNG